MINLKINIENVLDICTRIVCVMSNEVKNSFKTSKYTIYSFLEKPQGVTQKLKTRYFLFLNSYYSLYGGASNSNYITHPSDKKEKTRYLHIEYS